MRETNVTSRFTDEQIQAYHDGELSGLLRWRFERELSRNPELRAELDQLASIGEMLRVQDAAEPAPDLWGAIALRLPAADARRADAGAEAGATGGIGSLLSVWLRPIGAVAATAAVALLVLYGGLWPETPAASGGVVRWIDTGGRGVMMLDDTPDTTIIWVLDGPGEGAWLGTGRGEV